jgi:mRNA interferase MazF
MAAYIPDRGDIVWLTFDPQAGHEQSGRRPALVISPALYNRKAGLFVACPITTRQKGYPFEVPLPSTLGVAGVVLADQLRSLDWQARKATFAAKVPRHVIEDVVARIRPLVDPTL